MHNNRNDQHNNAMTIVKHRPQASFVSPFDELFSGFFGRDMSQFMGSDELHRSHPRVNIVEGKDGFKLDLLAPGYTKEDLKLNVENDMLTISAETKSRSLDETERWTRREFGHSAFKRSFRLPDNVSVDGITADHVNGVLSISIPKTEESKPKSRTISIG
ncbi:MAG: Hsp20/alpha crystallin family protein [Flavobacteriales bacterium]